MTKFSLDQGNQSMALFVGAAVLISYLQSIRKNVAVNIVPTSVTNTNYETMTASEIVNDKLFIIEHQTPVSSPPKPVEIFLSTPDDTEETKRLTMEAAIETAKGACKSSQDFRLEHNIFLYCRVSKHLKDLNDLLDYDPSLANCRKSTSDQSYGQTPLHHAAYHGNIKAMETLLQRGKISSFVRDLQGKTPLHIAAEREKEEAVRFLREAMFKERNIDPIGEHAPTDLIGSTPAGSCSKVFGGGGHCKGRPKEESLQNALFSPGDKSILPRQPYRLRAGVSPWKSSKIIKDKDLTYGSSEAPGWSGKMEDRVVKCSPISSMLSWSLFCVLDGHGGEGCVNFLQSNIHATLLEELNTLTGSNDVSTNSSNAPFLREVLLRTCSSLENKLRSHPKMVIIENSDKTFNSYDSSGSTATIVLITPIHVAIANIGDSRTILVSRTDGDTNASVHSKLIVEYETKDHKFNLPEEYKRAHAAARVLPIGGSYSEEQLEPLHDVRYEAYCTNDDGENRLRMSRSFGDFFLKNNSSLPIDQQAVVAIPDIHIHERSTNDRFLALACDGIWDVMTNEEVVEIIEKRVGKEGLLNGEESVITPEVAAKACDEILEVSLNRGSDDNLSAILVFLGKQRTADTKTDSFDSAIQSPICDLDLDISTVNRQLSFQDV